MFVEWKAPGEVPAETLEAKKAKLKGFVHLLRHEDLWPKGFKWNYTRCDTCAMGLACAVYGISSSAEAIANYFDIDVQAADRVCYDLKRFGLMSLVSAKQVARALEKLC